jgi:hypothetical protein
LLRALPSVRTWIEMLRGQYASAAQPASTLGFPRLAEYFSGEVLDATRVVTVTTKLPLPPIQDLGIEFIELSRMALSAVTYDDLVFVHQSLRTERVHFHELVHIVQWRALGVDRFLLTYGAGMIEHGYAHSPLEAIAYDLQSEFDRGVPMPDLEATVTRHACETAGSYDEFFSQTER